MEDNLNIMRRVTRESQRGMEDISREAKGESKEVPSGKETQREWRSLSKYTKENWESKRGEEDTLNIMRRRTRGRKRGMEDTF